MNTKKGKQKPDPTLTKIFSANLKSCIKTNEALANKVDVSPQAVADYVNGISIPRGDILYKISKELNKSMEWLLTGDNIEVVDEKKCSINCDERIMDLCRKVKEVVESNTHWGKSLEANIHSFKSGLDNDKDIKELKKSIRGFFAERPQKNTGKKKAM